MFAHPKALSLLLSGRGLEDQSAITFFERGCDAVCEKDDAVNFASADR